MYFLNGSNPNALKSSIHSFVRVRAIQRQSIRCAGLSYFSRSLNQPNERDQRDQVDQRDQMN
jgi:hypothetical protein